MQLTSKDPKDTVKPLDMDRVMDLTEFREKGYLQEVNRRFFHPLGLALCISRPSGTEHPSVINIADSREDPEGVEYGLAESTPERIESFNKKKALIDSEFNKRHNVRVSTVPSVRMISYAEAIPEIFEK